MGEGIAVATEEAAVVFADQPEDIWAEGGGFGVGEGGEEEEKGKEEVAEHGEIRGGRLWGI